MDSATSVSSTAADHRQGTRTHLFVIATLCCNEGSTPVHIRNMSAKGALIEAAVLPPAGSLVVLKRGSLEVSGRVAWVGARQAGLAFGSLVTIPDWMAKRANAHQDRIDEIVAQLRAQELPENDAIGPPSAAPIEQLQLLRSDLVRLGDALAADVILVATHPEIQLVDIALQRIDRIIRAFERTQSPML
jgi:hypothetical protein